MENTVVTKPLGRARTATLVAVGPTERLADVAEALRADENAGALHLVRIAIDGNGTDVAAARPDVITIGGLRPEYVNNAIAAVRLSSLPTIVWWRGGRPEGLDGVAALADRVVLDADDPWPLWARTPPLFDHTALTDVRWARLTRWRAALAHFFDLPAVRELAASFSRLSIAGDDRPQAALFAGWLDAAFGWRGRITPEFRNAANGAPLEAVTLECDACRLDLRLMPNSTCLSTEGRMGQDVIASRVVSLGPQTLPVLLAEELRVRSRDLAFEGAVQSALSARATST
jgi:glucose-6-phosphate dehydrogenase assembly protein OpcA